MGTISVAVDPTGLAILQRLHAVLHPVVEVGWPALRNADGTPAGDLLGAHTIVVDDHRFGAKEQAIIDAVLANPATPPRPAPRRFRPSSAARSLPRMGAAVSRPRTRLQDIQGARKARDLLKPATPAQFLDGDGQPALNFRLAICVGWVDDPALDAIPDAEDVVDAIGRAHVKLQAGDNTLAKIRTRLAAEIREAKDRRESRNNPPAPPVR